MSTVFDNLLEPLAVDMAKAEPNMRVREVAQMSTAVSAKRQADALERIAKAAERIAGTEYKGAMLTQRRGG